MKRRALIVVALLIALAVPLGAQTFTAQIQQFWDQLRTGRLTFTNISISGGTISGITFTGPMSFSSTSTTTSNPFSIIYTGATSPSNYYTNSLFSSNITLANAVPFATGVNHYYRYAPTDSDASGSSRIATLSYLQTGGVQNLSSFLYSLKARVIHLGTGSVGTIVGLESSSFNGHAGEQLTTGGNVTTMYGIRSSLFGQSSASTIGTQYGIATLVENDYGAGVTTAYGNHVNFSGPVVPTTSYGFFAGTILGTTKYSFYASDATAPNVFIGNVGIGGPPSFTLHVTKSANVFGDVLGRIENTNGAGNAAFAVWDITSGTNNLRAYTPSQTVAVQEAFFGTNGTLALNMGVGNGSFWQITGGGVACSLCGNFIPYADNTVSLGLSTKRVTDGFALRWNSALASLGTTPTDGVVLSSLTAATGGATVQMPGRIKLRGNAWDTAASQTVDFFIENLPATAATPTGTLKFGYSLNGAAVTYPATLTNGGRMTVLDRFDAVYYRWTASGNRLSSAGAKQWNFTDDANTAGVCIDSATDGTFKARTFGCAANAIFDAGSRLLASVLMDSATAPTIASGGCTSPAVTHSNGTAGFLLTIGTSCTGVKTIVLTLPASAHFWRVACDNNTSDAQQAANYVVGRATSTTAVTVTNYARVTGVQSDFTASDTLLCSARAE